MRTRRRRLRQLRTGLAILLVLLLAFGSVLPALAETMEQTESPASTQETAVTGEEDGSPDVQPVISQDPEEPVERLEGDTGDLYVEIRDAEAEADDDEGEKVKLNQMKMIRS